MEGGTVPNVTSSSRRFHRNRWNFSRLANHLEVETFHAKAVNFQIPGQIVTS
jgi:hypothetical protein